MIILIIKIVTLIIFLVCIFMVSTYMRGFPLLAIRYLQLSMTLFSIWALLSIIVEFYDFRTAISIYKVAMVFVNGGIIFVFMFHEFSAATKWYSSLRIKLYSLIAGLITGYGLFDNNVTLLVTSSGEYLPTYSSSMIILEYSFILMIVIHIIRRLLQVRNASISFKSVRQYRVPPLLTITFFGFLIIILVLGVADPTQESLRVLPTTLGSVVCLNLIITYTFNPFTPIFQGQTLYSLYALLPGGMPAFRYEFSTSDDPAIHDLMVSGALFSTTLMLNNIYEGSNRLESINLGSRHITFDDSIDLTYLLISDKASELLEMQLSQFTHAFGETSLVNEFGELREDFIKPIYEKIIEIFHTSAKKTDMKDLHVYPSYIEKNGDE